jgi:hypothetical protein
VPSPTQRAMGSGSVRRRAAARGFKQAARHTAARMVEAGGAKRSSHRCANPGCSTVAAERRHPTCRERMGSFTLHISISNWVIQSSATFRPCPPKTRAAVRPRAAGAPSFAAPPRSPQSPQAPGTWAAITFNRAFSRVSIGSFKFNRDSSQVSIASFKSNIRS